MFLQVPSDAHRAVIQQDGVAAGQDGDVVQSKSDSCVPIDRALSAVRQVDTISVQLVAKLPDDSHPEVVWGVLEREDLHRNHVDEVKVEERV